MVAFVPEPLFGADPVEGGIKVWGQCCAPHSVGSPPHHEMGSFTLGSLPHLEKGPGQPMGRVESRGRRRLSAGRGSDVGGRACISPGLPVAATGPERTEQVGDRPEPLGWVDELQSEGDLSEKREELSSRGGQRALPLEGVQLSQARFLGREGSASDCGSGGPRHPEHPHSPGPFTA